MLSYQYRKFYCEDKMIVRQSYLHSAGMRVFRIFPDLRIFQGIKNPEINTNFKQKYCKNCTMIISFWISLKSLLSCLIVGSIFILRQSPHLSYHDTVNLPKFQCSSMVWKPVKHGLLQKTYMVHLKKHVHGCCFVVVRHSLILPISFRASYTLRRHCFIGVGIPIINLRRSSDLLRLIMGILIPVRRRLLSEEAQGYFTGTGAIIWLPQCHWNNPEEYA